MIQIKKTILTLVALLALTAQAWAESKPIGLNVEYAAGDVITTNSTGDVYIWWGYYDSGGDIQEGAIKITSSVSPTISMLDIFGGYTGIIRLADNYSVYDKDGNKVREDPEIQCQGMVTGTTLEKVHVASGSGTLADPYVFAPGSAPKVYASGDVELFSLQVGDILMPGVTLTSVDLNNFAVANLISNRYSKDGVISQYSNSISSIPFSIGENGLLTAELAGNGPYNCMPITEDGKAGNAWVVTDVFAEPNYKTILIGGTTYPAPTGPEVAWDKAKKTGTFTMPGGNVTVSVEYYDLATLADKGLTAAEDAAAKTEAPLAVLADGAVTGGTLMYFVIYDENFSQADAIALAEDEWEAAIPTAETIDEAGTYYVWYYIKGDDEHSDTDPQRLAVTVLPEPTYTVEFAEGTNNAPNKWTATPNPAKKGQQVTVTYEGPRKVMGVKAEKKVAATDLSTINANYTASNGETLTGTLASNVQISIADGATVTLDGVTINGVNEANYEWAGITCLGDATIILSGTNTVKGFYQDYPGIQAAAGKTLIINGTGSLTASSYGKGAGIGGVNNVACGNIEIQDGTITATSVTYGAGIGGGDRADCGNITISGGIVTATGGERGAGIGGGRRGPDNGSCGNILISGGTVTATGGENAAGIGGGRGYNNSIFSSCGTITITSGVTKVTATKGDGATNSIGAGKYGTCGTVTIGGNVGAITTSPYTYQPSN